MQIVPQMQPVLAFSFEELIPVVVLVIWGLSQLFTGGSKKGDAERTPVDEEARRRAREIQEEIRRRIAERQAREGQGGTAPQQQPTVATRSEPPPMRPEPIAPMRREPVPQRTQPLPGPARNKIEELIRRVEEARRHQEEMERRARQAAEAPEAVPPPLRPAAPKAASRLPSLAAPAPTDSLAADLHDPVRLRRAVLLSEILGPPVALREATGSRH